MSWKVQETDISTMLALSVDHGEKPSRHGRPLIWDRLRELSFLNFIEVDLKDDLARDLNVFIFRVLKHS